MKPWYMHVGTFLCFKFLFNDRLWLTLISRKESLREFGVLILYYMFIHIPGCEDMTIICFRVISHKNVFSVYSALKARNDKQYFLFAYCEPYIFFFKFGYLKLWCWVFYYLDPAASDAQVISNHGNQCDLCSQVDC